MKFGNIQRGDAKNTEDAEGTNDQRHHFDVFLSVLRAPRASALKGFSV